jgi:ABC-2 type transport system permease protein
MRFLRLWKQFIKYSLLQSSIYRTDLIMRIVGMSVMAAMMVFVITLPYEYVDGLVGWRKSEALTVLGFYYLTNGVSWAFYRNGIAHLEQHIRYGSLDRMLLKPVNPIFLLSFFEVDFTRLVDVGVGLFIIILQVSGSGADITLTAVAGAVMAVILGLGFIFCLFLSVNMLAFWTTETYLDHLINPVFTVSKYPADLWGSYSWLLYWVAPVAFMSTVPAGILYGKVSWGIVLAGSGLLAVWLLAIRIYWRVAIRNYSSVGS